jgi:hypothetical protein
MLAVLLGLGLLTACGPGESTESSAPPDPGPAVTESSHQQNQQSLATERPQLPESMDAHARALVQHSFAGTFKVSMIGNPDSAKMLSSGLLLDDSLRRQTYFLVQSLLLSNLEGKLRSFNNQNVAEYLRSHPCEFGLYAKLFSTDLMQRWATALAEVNFEAPGESQLSACDEEAAARLSSLFYRSNQIRNGE